MARVIQSEAEKLEVSSLQRAYPRIGSSFRKNMEGDGPLFSRPHSTMGVAGGFLVKPSSKAGAAQIGERRKNSHNPVP
jgi:hypothetical protein